MLSCSFLHILYTALIAKSSMHQITLPMHKNSKRKILDQFTIWCLDTWPNVRRDTTIGLQKSERMNEKKTNPPVKCATPYQPQQKHRHPHAFFLVQHSNQADVESIPLQMEQFLRWVQLDEIISFSRIRLLFCYWHSLHLYDLHLTMTRLYYIFIASISQSE